LELWFWNNSKPHINVLLFNLILGDGYWRQAEAWNLLLARAVDVNALAQGALSHSVVGGTPNLYS